MKNSKASIGIIYGGKVTWFEYPQFQLRGFKLTIQKEPTLAYLFARDNILN